MTVATITQWRPTQGRQQELLASVARAKQIHERLGARVRVWQSTMAGPNAGLLSYVMEFDDLAAYARTVEQLQTDGEWQTFVREVLQAADPVATMVSNGMATEITPA